MRKLLVVALWVQLAYPVLALTNDAMSPGPSCRNGTGDMDARADHGAPGNLLSWQDGSEPTVATSDPAETDLLTAARKPYELVLVQPTVKPIRIRPGEVLNVSVQVHESKLGKPVPRHKVTFSLYYKDNPTDEQTVDLGPTDRHGIVKFQHRFDRYDAGRRAFLVFSTKGADPIKVPVDIYSW